jgi:hypothetical protein
MLLRLARRRVASMFVGLALVVPAAWAAGRFDAWWVEGLSLVVGATGAAFFWTGLTGPRADWTQ